VQLLVSTAAGMIIIIIIIVIVVCCRSIGVLTVLTSSHMTSHNVMCHSFMPTPMMTSMLTLVTWP
jgi:hypothetical protein